MQIYRDPSSDREKAASRGRAPATILWGSKYVHAAAAAAAGSRTKSASLYCHSKESSTRINRINLAASIEVGGEKKKGARARQFCGCFCIRGTFFFFSQLSTVFEKIPDIILASGFLFHRSESACIHTFVLLCLQKRLLFFKKA